MKKTKRKHDEGASSATDSQTAPPTRKKRRCGNQLERGENPAASILSLPPEVLENILQYLSASDLIAFGSTCCWSHELSLSQAVWKNLYLQFPTHLPPCRGEEGDWRRLAILKITQSLQLQRLSRSHGLGRSQRQPLTHTFNPINAVGCCKVVPVRDYALLLDNLGTIFVHSKVPGVLQWRMSLMCSHAKDFAVDPRSNAIFHKYIYVLVSQVADSTFSGNMAFLGLAPNSEYNCVKVYCADTFQQVLSMNFHSSYRFSQICLTGSETNRSVLLLTDTGKVHCLSVNESQLNTPESFAFPPFKRIGHLPPDLPIKQIHTNHNCVMYVGADGSVYSDMVSPKAYHRFFGTYAGYRPQTVFPITLSHKVVKCSIGPTHLCMLDDRGRIFMQGCNRYGQLGTGDTIDRNVPTQVELPMAAVDVWCGLNHTLALLEQESGDKLVQGCGCGSGGRLPGWAKGSNVFVTLNVQVPHNAKILCSSHKYLYLASSHDINEMPASGYTPSVRVGEAH